MQVNQSGSPFQLRLDPAPYRANALSTDQAARRQLTASAADKLFTDTQRQLSEGRRVDVLHKSRAPLYRQVQQDLQDVSAQLGALQQAITSALGVTSPDSVTSPAPLNLGASGAGGVGSTSAPAPVEATLDPTATLSSQPFQAPIASGSLDLSFRVNGGPLTAASVVIDPATQSLNDVLGSLSSVTIGGVQPLSATFDAASQQIRLDVTSTSGNSFDFSLVGGSGGFQSAIAADAFSSATNLKAAAPIDDSVAIKTYNELTVSVAGVGTQTFSALEVSSSALTPNQKLNELVGQLNAGLTGLGITAVNAGGGTLGFQRTVTDLAQAGNLGVSVTETNRAGAIALGFQPGATATASVRLDPSLSATAAAPTAPDAAGPLGPDRTLSDLAGQLGLTPRNGRFELEANGKPLSFTQDQTVDDVIAGISATGLAASYNPESRTITVLNPDGAPVTISDRSGNLAAALGLDAGAASRNDAALGQSLRELADALDGVTGLIESGTGAGTGLGSDRLLADLQASLSGLFASNANGPLSGLGDLGITRVDGQVRVDASKLQDVLADRRGDVESFLGSFIGEKVAPLLRAGSRAVASSDEIAPAEAEAAARSVRVRGEISRLQVRQQMLTLERQNFENFKASIERQHEQLARIADDIALRTPTGLQADAEQAAREAAFLGRDRSGFTSPPTTVGPATTAAAAPALGSFGLSNASTA